MYTEIDGKVYKDGVFMGSTFEAFGTREFSQYSDCKGQIYSVDEAKKFLAKEYGITHTELKRGQSTKTQVWFRLKQIKGS
jgi:hypothetical protein